MEREGRKGKYDTSLLHNRRGAPFTRKLQDVKHLPLHHQVVTVRVPCGRGGHCQGIGDVAVEIRMRAGPDSARGRDRDRLSQQMAVAVGRSDPPRCWSDCC